MSNSSTSITDRLALVAAVSLPFWNIPLIWRIVERQSSQDISLAWCLGVFACILVMAPQGLRSPDKVWRLFNVANLFWFTGVVIAVLVYR